MGGVIGFFTPYVFVGALAIMGSLDYRMSVSSDLFLISVFVCTLMGALFPTEGGGNLRSH